MVLVVDTGPIVAALNSGDPDHARCARLLRSGDDLVVPGPVLVEVDYWLRKLGGVDVWATFAADVARGSYRVVPIGEDDLTRAAELEVTYADLALGFVDASVIAVCERLDADRVATLDRRRFSVVRPRHRPHLELLPDQSRR